MKKILLVVTAVFTIAAAIYAAEPTLEQKQALFVMNYAQYAIYKIKTYNNIVLLEDEYYALNNNLNLELIKDRASINEINTLNGLITDEIKNNKNVEMLKNAIEKRMSQAIYQSIPTATALFYGKVDPLSLVLNTVRTASTMYMSYRQTQSSLQQEYDQELWNIDQHRLDQFDQNYQHLNTFTHQLIQKYGISDGWRLNEQELTPLFKILKDTDKERKYKNLKDLTENKFYNHFPLFWYYLANAAYEVGREKEVLEYYTKFEHENIPIFRYDSTACDAYKGKITLLIKDSEKNKQEIINKLAFIKENSALEDGNKWKNYYYCALVYEKLGMHAQAVALLEQNIRHLSLEIENRYVKPEQLKRIRFAEIPAGSMYQDGIELSRKLLAEIKSGKTIAVKTLEQQYQQDSAGYNEYIHQFAGVTSSSIIEARKNILHTIQLDYKVRSASYFHVDCVLPVQWIMNSNANLEIIVYMKDGKEYAFPLTLDEKQSKKLSKRKNNNQLAYTADVDLSNGKENKDGFLKSAWNKLFSKGNAGFLSNSTGILGLRINHPIYPVELQYRIEPLKTNKGLQHPESVVFNGKPYEF
ncbi:MAG: hypothetical protein ACTTI6_10675 [Treponema sp.]|uniref:hypothetical protein n=1 Tax=Treponema sp. TaxID=166 RepID=UPI003FA29DC1